jgi:hypothetical protein
MIHRERGVAAAIVLACVGLSWAPIALPCTVALVAGKAAKNGRALMWKNRDTTEVNNRLMHFAGPRFAFMGLVNAGDAEGKEVWAGLNAAGFAIMNSQVNDLADPGKKGDPDDNDNALVMKLALGECATVGDFERLLVREQGRFDLAANFGVIDAEGGACLFETASVSFQKFDVQDTRTAPAGTIVRTNFAFTSPEPLKGGGFIRFERVSHLFEAGRGANRLDVRFMLQEAARDLVNEKLHSYPLSRPLPDDPAEPLFVNTNDTINRNTSVSAIVFEGAPSRDQAHLATMWVILGQPVAGVAVPVWPGAGRVPAVTTGATTCPLNDFSRALASHLYPDRRGRMPQYLNVNRLRAYGGEGVLAKLFRIEDEVLARTAAKLVAWEAQKPLPDHVAEFQESLAGYAFEALKQQFSDIR